MPRGNLIAFMVVVLIAIVLAELQERAQGAPEVSTRWVCLALIWIILTAMLIFTAYG